MAYFERGTGWPEQLGKVIGDTFSAFIFISVILLIVYNVLLR